MRHPGVDALAHESNQRSQNRTERPASLGHRDQRERHATQCGVFYDPVIKRDRTVLEPLVRSPGSSGSPVRSSGGAAGRGPVTYYDSPCLP